MLTNIDYANQLLGYHVGHVCDELINLFNECKRNTAQKFLTDSANIEPVKAQR